MSATDQASARNVPGEETSLAGSKSGITSSTSYSSTSSSRTSPTSTGPVRYVLSGIKPSLYYVETVGIIVLILTVPLLTEPVIGSKQTHTIDHFLLHGLSIGLAYLISGFVSGIFAELHHYYPSCGGIVHTATSVSGSSLSYLALAVSLSAALLQVAFSVTCLSDLLNRQSEYYFADSFLHSWSNAAGVNVVSLFLVLLIFVVSLLGLLVLSRVAVLVSTLSLASLIVVAGYGVHHGTLAPRLNLRSKMITGTNTEYQNSTLILGSAGTEEPLIDNNLHSYTGYLINIISQVIVVNLLMHLTEDNKLTKPIINILVAAVFLVLLIMVLFLNLALAHITSDTDVFIDQISRTVGVPTQAVLTISVLSGVALVVRGAVILYTTCRAFVHVVVGREEAGLSSLLCKILKLPIFVTGMQCLIIAGTIFLKKEDLSEFSLVSLFLYIGLGGVCFTLHRYATPLPQETAPIIGSFGALRAETTIKILLAFFIISSIALCVSDILGDYIDIPTYASKQIYAVIRISMALIVVGAVSVMASFRQRTDIHKIYRWFLWTPIVPSCVILLSTVVLVYNWVWGAIIVSFTLLLSLVLLAVDRVSGRWCCTTLTSPDAM